jgi:hypothetical protein
VTRPRWPRRGGRCARRSEAGVALAVAVAVMFIVVLLSTAAVRQSMDGITQAGIANQQVQSIAAAEAGIQFEEKALSTSQTAFVCPSTTASTLATGVSFGLIYLIQTGGTVPSRTAMTSVALSATLSTSAPITSLAVGALQVAIAAGSNITVVAGGNLQTFNTSAAAAVGATTIQIMSVTPSFAFPVLSTVTLGTACTSSAAVTLSTTATSYILLKSAGSGRTLNLGAQTVEALLQVTGPFSFAVHGDGGLSLPSANVTASGSIYAGARASSLPCSATTGAATVTGDVVSASTSAWTISNSCTVGGSVLAAGAVTISSTSSSIAGTLKTPSSINVSGQPATAYASGDAAGAITVPGGTTIPVGGACPTTVFKACTSYDSSVVAPVSDPFPSITAVTSTTSTPPSSPAFPSPTWTTTNQTFPETCSNDTGNIAAAAAVGSGSQLVVLPPAASQCGTLSIGGGSVTINNNLAVILPQGLSATSTFSFVAGTRGPWNVYLVVPSGSTSSIAFSAPSFDPNLNIFMYTPGNVALTGFTNTGLHGQIYAAGTVSSTSGFNLAYAHVPVSGLRTDAGSSSALWEFHST